ncbi:hypothetical protein NPIL_237721 [Nephila pilipes]|uniref:Uncharacterized protein n=1 Tax=Nephila pilipes TaxID=299642 RepID=A0A8X6TIJ0_NEPPI|nr:hypothetical protein NPIL_237721 [Nephila pilipes]
MASMSCQELCQEPFPPGRQRRWPESTPGWRSKFFAPPRCKHQNNTALEAIQIKVPSKPTRRKHRRLWTNRKDSGHSKTLSLSTRLDL